MPVEGDLRLGQGNVERGRPVRILVDGEAVEAYEGETLAAALLASGRRVFRRPAPGGRPGGLFCGMGICYECLVEVAGEGHCRACSTPVREGMRVSRLTG